MKLVSIVSEWPHMLNCEWNFSVYSFLENLGNVEIVKQLLIVVDSFVLSCVEMKHPIPRICFITWRKFPFPFSIEWRKFLDQFLANKYPFVLDSKITLSTLIINSRCGCYNN